MTTSGDVCSEDIRLESPAGGLFVKRWTPPGDEAGARPPLVLLHDSLGSVAQWRTFPAEIALASRRRVVAYDRAGFGRSDPHPGQVPIDFIAAEASGGFRHVIQGLAIDRFAVLGHSVGGGMAVGVAAAYPLQCESLITLAAQAFVEDRTVAGIQAAREAFVQPGQVDRLRRYHGDKTDWVLSAWIDRWLDPAFATWSLDPQLPRVMCRSLVLHGRHDAYGSHRHPERIAERSRGTSCMHLGDWGHVPHREQPGEILQLLADFLTR